MSLDFIYIFNGICNNLCESLWQSHHEKRGLNNCSVSTDSKVENTLFYSCIITQLYQARKDTGLWNKTAGNYLCDGQLQTRMTCTQGNWECLTWTKALYIVKKRGFDVAGIYRIPLVTSLRV